MQKLFDVVFGQKEFDKTKIEVRFDLIDSFLSMLSIESIDDFEQLEACIYKIKDQLRVKSSNLNKVIKDPNKPLTKNKVQKVLNSLYEIRNNFLNEAFKVLGKDLPKKDVIKSPREEVLVEIPEVIEESVEEVKESLKFDPLLFESQDFKITLSQDSTPYLIVEFKNSFNLILIKYLSSFLFESINSHGTNIIIENNKALIIPRFVNDSTLPQLPQISNSNLDEIFSKIKKIQSSDEVEFKEEELKESIDEKEKKEVEEFKELTSNDLKREKTLNKKEESLDSLLGSIDEKSQDPTPKPDPKKDEDKIILEKVDEKIELEKKEKNILESQGIEVEKVDDSEKQNDLETKSTNLTVYLDDQIHVYLNDKSKSFGEIIIEHNSGKSFSNLEESQISYLTIFTKIFGSILFETLQAHGTNIIWNSNDTKLHIIPRLQNDVLNLTWNPRKDSEEFLDQIKNKLLQAMNKSLGNSDESKSIQDTSKSPSQKEPQNSDDLKRKAQALLNELRKIP